MFNFQMSLSLNCAHLTHVGTSFIILCYDPIHFKYREMSDQENTDAWSSDGDSVSTDSISSDSDAFSSEGAKGARYLKYDFYLRLIILLTCLSDF